MTATDGQKFVINLDCACRSNGTDDAKFMNDVVGENVTVYADGADEPDCLDGIYGVTCLDGAYGEDGADISGDL